MEKPYIVVFGASGNIGGKVADELLSHAATIGVVGRKAVHLAKFEGKADILEGDFGNDNFLKHALGKATAVFLTVPDQFLVDPAATASRLHKLLAGSNVSHIVNISNSITEKNGAPTRLVAFEKELDKVIKVPVVHVRCGNFFDNLNWGINTPYHPDLKLPYIASYEVAHRIATFLLEKNFEGKSVEVLLGPADFSMKELAAAAGQTYQQLPYTPENESFFRPFNENNFKVEPRTEQNTSRLEQERFTLAYFLENDLSV